MQLKNKSLLNGFILRLLVCVRYVKGMLICALFGIRELNTSDFRTSELRALNIEYFRYVRGEAYNSSFNLARGSGTH